MRISYSVLVKETKCLVLCAKDRKENQEGTNASSSDDMGDTCFTVLSAFRESYEAIKTFPRTQSVCA